VPADPFTPTYCPVPEPPFMRPEDAAVTEAGWTWMGSRGQDGIVVTTGAAGHDGMCRLGPHHQFVFVLGLFAGTVAPVPMFARTDGVGGVTHIDSSGSRLWALFTRYADTDALCWPSLPPTLVEYRIEQTEAGPVLLAVRAVTTTNGSPAPVSSATEVPGLSVPTQPTPLATREPQWAPVARFTGTPPGQTPAFVINSERWSVRWSYTGTGSFGLRAEPVGDPPGRRAQSLTQPFRSSKAGAAALTGSGRWFLVVTEANGSWVLDVEELR